MHRFDATAFGVLLMAAWPVAVIAYDVWLFLSGRETISERTLSISRVAPVFAVLIAGPVFFLLSHLFFPQRVLPRPPAPDDRERPDAAA